MQKKILLLITYVLFDIFLFPQIVENFFPGKIRLQPDETKQALSNVDWKIELSLNERDNLWENL